MAGGSALTDEQLITRASTGDLAAVNATIDRFRDLAVRCAKSWSLFLPGGDSQDLEQEAMIGIWKAARSWDPARGATAKSFVLLCVRRHLFTAVKTQTRGKHTPLNVSVRTERDHEGEAVESIALLEQPHGEPSSILIERERLEEIADDIRIQLSPFEARCLLMYVNGASYEQIQERLDRSFKQVDQAMCRARWKLQREGPPSKPDLRLRVVSTKPCEQCGRQTGAGTARVPRPPVCCLCAMRAAA